MAASIADSLPDYSDEEYILDHKALSLHHGAVGPVALPGNYLSRQLVGEALKDRIDRIDHDNCEAGDEDAFFVADLGEVYRQHVRWKMSLGRVVPHYGASIILRQTFMD
jgi:ornithine decarboxylase